MSKNHLLIRNALALLSVFILISSCGQKEKVEMRRVETPNFSIEVPVDFEKTNNLNKLAPIQYQNVKKDFYFLMLEEPKMGFHEAIAQGMYSEYKVNPDLDGYFKVLTSHFDDIMDDFTVTDIKRVKINSANATIFTISGVSIEFKKAIVYRYAIIDDGTNYYQLMSWTNPGAKRELIDRMQDVIFSFKSKIPSQKN
jgi:hypothetical protein